MKLRFSFLLLLVLFSSCISDKNTDEFIQKVSGRYLFNTNEAIEIYFKESVLYAKWRGNNEIHPLKVNDSTFYFKELNEKLIFVSSPKLHIKLAEKTAHEGKKYHFRKLENNEKTPLEYFENREYGKALAAYLIIQQKDSLDKAIKQTTLNRIGYRYINKEEYERALAIFKINVALYPESSNVYDSLGEAYLLKKDTVNAILNYKKALSINKENRNAQEMLKRITTK